MKRHSKYVHRKRRTSVRQIDGRKFTFQCKLGRNRYSSLHTPWVITHDGQRAHFMKLKDAIWACHGG